MFLKECQTTSDVDILWRKAANLTLLDAATFGGNFADLLVLFQRLTEIEDSVRLFVEVTSLTNVSVKLLLNKGRTDQRYCRPRMTVINLTPYPSLACFASGALACRVRWTRSASGMTFWCGVTSSSTFACPPSKTPQRPRAHQRIPLQPLSSTPTCPRFMTRRGQPSSCVSDSLCHIKGRS